MCSRSFSDVPGELDRCPGVGEFIWRSPESPSLRVCGHEEELLVASCMSTGTLYVLLHVVTPQHAAGEDQPPLPQEAPTRGGKAKRTAGR